MEFSPERAQELERILARKSAQAKLYNQNQLHRERRRAVQKQSYMRHREESTTRMRERHQRYRLLALVALSGDPPSCQKCGFQDIRALQIDHVNGGGNRARQTYSDNTRFFLRVSKSVDKQRYQVLCANCNWIKKAERQEV